MDRKELVKLKTKAVTMALVKHPRKHDLIEAGKLRDSLLRDSLLRALIPLYVTQSHKAWFRGPNGNEEIKNLVTCGVTQRLWRSYGVKVQSTVIAKALREHVGYARRTRDAIQITPNGIRYVRKALNP